MFLLPTANCCLRPPGAAQKVPRVNAIRVNFTSPQRRKLGPRCLGWYFELKYTSGTFYNLICTDTNALCREIITIQAGQCGNNGMLLSSADFDRNEPKTAIARMPDFKSSEIDGTREVLDDLC